MSRKTKICGIYRIRNSITNDIYIGSSINIKDRFSCHKSFLNKNKHHSIILQRAWKKYGPDNFYFETIEECLKENLIIREQYYLDQIKPKYNISPCARNCLGIKHSLESNLKKSLNHAFRGKFGKDNPSSQLIYQYSLNGIFLKKWHGAHEIERELGFCNSNIYAAIKRNGTAYNYIWKSEFHGDKIKQKLARDKSRSTQCKQIGMFDLNDCLLKVFFSQKEVSNYLNLNRNGCLSNTLKSKKKLAYGYKWSIITYEEYVQNIEKSFSKETGV
jgi:group I intron endonuclease